MPLTYRVPEPDELEAFMRPVLRGFGDPAPEPHTLDDERVLWEPARSIGALDGDDWVGGTGAFTMDLTLPGGAAVAAAGVTMVGVASTHKRRGILTELMRRQLDDVAAGPEPVAILTASESVIYGRFGYGLATRGVRQRLAVGHARFRPDAPVAGGRLRVMTIDEARAALPEVYERIRPARPGWVRRSPAWWETHVFLDRPDRRDGASALYVLAHHDDRGAVDGWATFRVVEAWPDRLPASRVVAREVAAVDDAVQLALWRGLVDVDLSVEVDALHVAVDDPLPWAVADPRRVRTSELTDWLWLRILDVAAALGPRRWGGAGEVVLEVVDPFRPASGGRFVVAADPDGSGTVTPSEAPADLVLGAEELGALALGGVPPTTLARAGRITEERPGALAVADTLFRAERAPHCATMF
ncbi:GNAT family N-acetyltransferase [Iamia sp. SCSIO 61187]|uniref:GNAT family N-acetyltransferase n=1 Tax=Iamia sp. SCSIO 61187 TaxID=2722752 RepID=UPI001C629E7F|nr:GNAT family N-acetyltransferase [Iamia sp. SCSIO 61187]QYG94550.1 GNAT family N-acetyltransferase [Iamia sp. SCSIO 61187]